MEHVPVKIGDGICALEGHKAGCAAKLHSWTAMYLAGCVVL
jgi:hypothetical protein